MGLEKKPWTDDVFELDAGFIDVAGRRFINVMSKLCKISPLRENWIG